MEVHTSVYVPHHTAHGDTNKKDDGASINTRHSACDDTGLNRDISMTHNGTAVVAGITVKSHRVTGISLLLKQQLARSIGADCTVIGAKRPHARPTSGWEDMVQKYRIIHKSLRDFRTRLRNNQDRHGRKEHINR